MLKINRCLERSGDGCNVTLLNDYRRFILPLPYEEIHRH